MDIDGVTPTLHFKRMSVSEFIEWERQYFSYRQPKPGVPIADDDPEIVKKGLEALAWIEHTLTEFVTVPEGELEIDGQPITTGKDLYAEFGTNTTLMWELMSHIVLFHRFDERTRKNLLSLSASPTSSVVPATEAAGEIPGPTAASVDDAGSARTEGAPQGDVPTAAPPGETATS